MLRLILIHHLLTLDLRQLKLKSALSILGGIRERTLSLVWSHNRSILHSLVNRPKFKHLSFLSIGN